MDTHLLTTAVAAMGTAIGAAVLIALALIAGLFITQHWQPADEGGLTARTHESLPGKPAPRESSSQ